MSTKAKRGDFGGEKPKTEVEDPSKQEELNDLKGGVDESASPDQMRKADKGKTKDTDYKIPGFSGWSTSKDKV
jgi:hypothetical protein